MSGRARATTRKASQEAAVRRLEDAIERWIRPESSLDGHDFGMGEMNIFVDTDDAMSALLKLATLRKARSVPRANACLHCFQQVKTFWPAVVVQDLSRAAPEISIAQRAASTHLNDEFRVHNFDQA